MPDNTEQPLSRQIGDAIVDALQPWVRRVARAIDSLSGNIILRLGDSAAGTKLSILRGDGVEAFWFKSDGTSSISPGGTPVTGSGTPGKLAKFGYATVLADSIVSESGTTLTVAGNVALTGTVDGVDVSDFYAERGAANGLAQLSASSVLVAGQFPALTGDVTTVAGALAATLANSGVSANTYGSASLIPVLTVDAKGRITAASTVAVVLAADSVATKTADYTLTDSDAIILADCSSGDIVMILPAVSGRTGRKFTIKRIVATSNNVYIIGNALEKVEAGLYGVYLQYAGQDSAITLECDGVQWRGIAFYGSSPASAAPVCDLQQPAPTSLTSGVSTVDFGSVVVGNSSSPKTFTIQDDGRPNLGITSAAVGGGSSGDFPVNTAGMAAIIAYNATTTFAVTFTPTALGARSTTLTVTSTAGTFTVTLTGTGTGSYSWIPWDIFIMASIASGAQPGVGGENSVSWFNSAT